MSVAGLGALAGAPKFSGARELGAGRRSYGDRSSFETATRSFNPSATPGTGSSRTPLQDLHGIITPSSLHFERHHSGVPAIDPKKHQLLIDGLVKEPLVFSIEDLLRLPSVSRIHFIECAGNSGREHEGSPGPDVQKSHGLLSCSEWMGHVNQGAAEHPDRGTSAPDAHATSTKLSQAMSMVFNVLDSTIRPTERSEVVPRVYARSARSWAVEP